MSGSESWADVASKGPQQTAEEVSRVIYLRSPFVWSKH
ncbi:hypothetical protein VDGD_08267 [Verticillium dahliae]|nr:hypothetical protein VDGD_08267 [Verticillium dahliae]